MKTIDIKNNVVLIDDEDYERVIQYHWYVRQRHKIIYVEKSYWNEGKAKHQSLHRFILNALPGQYIDHINGNGLDNRRSNIRFCTIEQNQQNRKKESGTKNRYKGTWFDLSRNKWRARIEAKGVRHFLGSFITEYEAAIAYNRAAKIYHGEFARLNMVK